MTATTEKQGTGGSVMTLRDQLAAELLEMAEKWEVAEARLRKANARIAELETALRAFEPEFTDDMLDYGEWCVYCGVWRKDRSRVVRHEDDCPYILRAAVLGLPDA